MPLTDLELLRQLRGGPVSGDALARRHGLTRAAIWKRVRQLRDAGVEIEAVRGEGYSLPQPVDLLDADAIRSGLNAHARGELAGLQVAWSLDSTNSELLRRAAPEHGASVLLCERQTAGRGRRGRHWTSPLAANLYVSLSRRFDGGLARLGGLSLAAGVAVADALHALGVEGVRLKWPNDVGVDGRKLGGLLVEGSGEPAGAARAVVGIGLNVRMPAAHAVQIDQPWIDLSVCMTHPPSRNALASALLEHVLATLALFDAEGLAPFLPRYAKYDALKGREVAVHLGDAVHHGTALGVAESGALQVLVDGVRREFHSGEVSVRIA